MPHTSQVLIFTEGDAAAIRAAFDQGGELSAVVELRRGLPGITENAHARAGVCSIAGWSASLIPLRLATRLRLKGHT